MVAVAFFSNQFADAQGHGLARYARELHAALRQREDVKAVPVAGWSSLQARDLAQLQSETGLRLTGLGRRLTPLMWTYLDRPTVEYLLPVEIDAVHAVSLGYPIATRKPFVVTVHDLGPLTHPEFFGNTRPWVMERSLRQAERKADLVVCVSQSTADEVAGYLGNGIADRLRVVHEGVSPEFFETADPDCLAGLDLPDPGIPFILSAGKISPRKNLQGVLQAMSRLQNTVPHHLVLVGGRGWDTEAALASLDDPSLRSRVHLLDYVADAQLRALYQRAAIYVHPSLYEGFGLTVIEAMASGTPVVTSNTSSLPEVAGDAAMLVDPASSDAIAEALEALCLDPGLCERKTAEGRARARLFDWSDCARTMAGIYAEIAK